VEASPRPTRKRWLIAAVVVALIAVAATIGAFGFGEARRTLCLSNQRRLAVGLLLYSQDYAGCFPPVRSKMETGRTRFWLDAIDAYLPAQGLGTCPANPAEGCADARSGEPFGGSFALNERFFGRFSPGPMAVDNLDLAAQTVLLAEAGPKRERDPLGPGVGGECQAGYWDTGQQPLFYPSPHSGKMCVSAADGHALPLKVVHYSLEGHDPVLGRLGERIYNWNGGFPNGDLRGGPRE
jgi:hypothetical protein